MSSFNLQAFGVALTVATNDRSLLEALTAVLPPGHELTGDGEATTLLVLDREPSATTFRVVHGEEAVIEGAELSVALSALDSRIRLIVAAESPELVFVHAGVVAHEDRAVVLPGVTLAGKTELVTALMSEGATYFSDEFAVLDRDGLVHPYPRALTLRRGGPDKARVSAADLGAATGTERVPVGVVARTRYEPAGKWQPRTCSAAEGAMFLLAHAGQTRQDAERVLESVTLAADGALVLDGPRGEARPAARALLAAAAQAGRG